MHNGSVSRAVLLSVLVLLIAGVAMAGSYSAVSYPQNYKKSMVKYAVVDRGDGFSRDLYASRDAIDAIKRNPRLSEFPVGVMLALEVHSARVSSRDPKTQAPRFEKDAEGHLLRSKDEHTLHLMAKTQAGLGSKNWTYGGYDPITAVPLKLDLPGDCLLCHQAALASDMTYSMTLMKRFVSTGVVQYSFCPHPGRQACAFH